MGRGTVPRDQVLLCSDPEGRSLEKLHKTVIQAPERLVGDKAKQVTVDENAGCTLQRF